MAARRGSGRTNKRRATLKENMYGGKSNAEMTEERLKERAEELKRRRGGLRRLGVE